MNKTIVSKFLVDPVTKKKKQFYYYSEIEIKDGVAFFRINDKHPLSKEEVDEFNRKKDGKGV